MARGVNEVTIIGNLGNDPEVRYSQSGACVTTISVATSESWKDKNGEQHERAEWHRIKFFGRLAEIVGEYLKKGRQIYVKGKLRYGSYEKDGVTHYTTDIIGEEMQILGGGGDRGDRGGGDEAGQRRQHREQQQGRARESKQQGQAPSYGPPGRDAHQRSDDPFDDSDVPF